MTRRTADRAWPWSAATLLPGLLAVAAAVAAAWPGDALAHAVTVGDKIYLIGGGAHVGLVDESRGMHRAAPVKPVQLCIRVADVDAWYAYARARGLAGLSGLFVNDALGIRAFVFEDPEGYQIELQSATREGA